MGLVCTVAATTGTDRTNPKIPIAHFRTASFTGVNICSCFPWYPLQLSPGSALMTESLHVTFVLPDDEILCGQVNAGTYSVVISAKLPPICWDSVNWDDFLRN
jgi:hypothetical protein